MHARVAKRHTLTIPERFAGAIEMPETMAGVPAGVFSSFALDDRIDATSSLQLTADKSRVVRALMVVVMMFSFLFWGGLDQFVSVVVIRGKCSSCSWART
jgi:hypothetical protein